MTGQMETPVRLDAYYVLASRFPYVMDIQSGIVSEDEPTRTPYEQSKSAINRQFCYNKINSYDLTPENIAVFFSDECTLYLKSLP